MLHKKLQLGAACQQHNVCCNRRHKPKCSLSVHLTHANIMPRELQALQLPCITLLMVKTVLQILQLSQHDKAITIYYHPNSFSSTQSIRSNLANCWRFTVALETPEVRTAGKMLSYAILLPTLKLYVSGFSAHCFLACCDADVTVPSKTCVSLLCRMLDIISKA